MSAREVEQHHRSENLRNRATYPQPPWRMHVFVCVSEREVEDHNRSEMQPPWEPSGGHTEGIVCCLMEMVMLVMMFRTEMMQMMKQHSRIVFEIVSSQILLLPATHSSSICIPDFLESAIQVSCTCARQLQLKPFLLGSNRCRPTRDYHNCAPPWLHLLHGATPKDDTWQLLPSENARVAAWVQEQQLNPFLLDPRRNQCQE